MSSNADFSFNLEDLAEQYDFEEGGTQTIVLRQGGFALEVELDMDDDPIGLFDADFQIKAYHWGHGDIPFFHRHEDVLKPEVREDYLATTEPILTSRL